MLKQSNEPAYRHELKYLVSAAQIEILKTRICGIMSLDRHVMAQGSYNIRSLYFDDYQNRCFYENENGNDPRSKYRIRIYNHSSDRISLERKRKERGKTLKTACRISPEQAACLMAGDYLTDIPPGQTLLKQLCAEIMVNRMRPVIITEYERIPYVYPYGNVRVTFDTGISSSDATAAFFEAEIPKRPVLPAGMQLLEVKFDAYLPDVIYRGLQLENLRQIAFSKYYLSRKYSI